MRAHLLREQKEGGENPQPAPGDSHTHTAIVPTHTRA